MTRHQDDIIGKMFDNSYRSTPSPVNVDDFDASLKFYTNYIIDKKAESVMDIGMGAGGLLLALQNLGVRQVYGIELSSEGVELAKRRFELFGDTAHSEFFVGNFLDYPLNNFKCNVDVITLHRVLHCYPEFQNILTRCVEINPKYIIYTLPKNTLLPKLFLGFISFLSKPITGFKAYVHPTDQIKNILHDNGYEELHYSSTRFWETQVFGRIDK